MIIGIIGRIGAGKDTVAQIIQELQPEHNWQIKKFAGKLKQVASILTGIPVEDFEKQEVKESLLPDCWNYCPFTPNGYTTTAMMTVREFLQRLGTEAIRDWLHQNAWVNALMSDYKPMYVGPLPTFADPSCATDEVELPNWLVTDVRFPNEVDAIKNAGGVILRVDRMNNPYPKSNHISETALDHLQLPTIINHGTIDNLREVVGHALKMIQNEP